MAVPTSGYRGFDLGRSRKCEKSAARIGEARTQGGLTRSGRCSVGESGTCACELNESRPMGAAGSNRGRNRGAIKGELGERLLRCGGLMHEPRRPRENSEDRSQVASRSIFLGLA